MAWEENLRICLNIQLIAILSRTGVSIRIQNSAGSRQDWSVRFRTSQTVRQLQYIPCRHRCYSRDKRVLHLLYNGGQPHFLVEQPFLTINALCLCRQA